MDSRGGCCIARYATGAYDVNKIMLRFRPIAPKPVAGTSISDGSSSESSDAFFKGGRKKRKYVRDNNNNTSKRRTRRKTTTSLPEQKHPAPVVTLPLLPETPDPKESPAVKEVKINNSNKNNNSSRSNTVRNVPVWLSFENRNPAKVEVEPYWYSGAVDPSAVRFGGWYSCVMVECVTDTYVEGELLGNTDEERRSKLSNDTCPGFISDGYGRVTWQNGAYWEMMKREGDNGEGLVLLVMKVGAVFPYSSFTCRVRVVQYACGKEKSSLTVPCDVWRMDCGGFAWRLDVKAALSLRLLGC